MRIEASRICLVRLSAIGDIVHALALANGLRRGYPHAEITWIIRPLPYEVVRHQPGVDRFIVLDDRRGMAGWRQLRSELRDTRFDLALIPQVSIKSSVVASMVRSPIKLGFDLRRSREFSWLFTNRRIPQRPAQHVQDQFLEFLEYLGIDPTPEWNLVFTDAENHESYAFFRSLGKPAIGLVIASSSPDKDWNAAGYAAVADGVSAMGFTPLLIGGPSDRERQIAGEIARLATRPVTLALDKPLRTTLWKLRGSSVVVAPDTGPMHAAVALNVPTVALLGYSNPRRCGPYRFSELMVDCYSSDSKAGEPVTRRTKRGRMDEISAEMVLDRIGLALKLYPAADR